MDTCPAAILLVTAKISEVWGSCDLDSLWTESYLQLIPIHRFPAAHSCARRFFVWRGLSSEEIGHFRPVELKKGREWLVLPG
jgi:hypothetical protein